MQALQPKDIARNHVTIPVYANHYQYGYRVFDVRRLGKNHELSTDFKLHEFQSNCGHPIVLIHPALVQLVQSLRDFLGKPLTVTNAYRTEAHNAKVGGSKNSRHLYGMAIDVTTGNKDDLAKIAVWASRNGVGGIGIYESFIHLDLGGVRQWSS